MLVVLVVIDVIHIIGAYILSTWFLVFLLFCYHPLEWHQLLLVFGGGDRCPDILLLAGACLDRSYLYPRHLAS